MPSDKKFKNMNQDEKLECLLEAKISDAKLVLKHKLNDGGEQENVYRYMGQLFAYEEALKLYLRMKEGKL